VSAETGDNVDRLLDVMVSHLPEGPRLFPTGQVSDQPERQLAAEILREKLIRRGREELPHSIAVTVDDVVPDEEREDLLRIDAVVHVERDSQKGIVIGKGGSNLKAAATEARHELEVLFGAKVYLSTHVRSPRSGSATPSSWVGSATDRLGTQPGREQR
jgi:GTPase